MKANKSRSIHYEFITEPLAGVCSQAERCTGLSEAKARPEVQIYYSRKKRDSDGVPLFSPSASQIVLHPMVPIPSPVHLPTRIDCASPRRNVSCSEPSITHERAVRSERQGYGSALGSGRGRVLWDASECTCAVPRAPSVLASRPGPHRCSSLCR